jgi:hypothetical protein
MIKCFLLAVSITMAFFTAAAAEEQEISLDSVSEPTNEPAKQEQSSYLLGTQDGLHLNLYADFDVSLMSVNYLAQISQQEDTVTSYYSNKYYFSFSQYHFQVILKGGYQDNVSVGCDTALNFFEITYQFNPKLAVTFGKIFLPFGEFDNHHIYGGMVDETGTFLPKFWCDYGISVSFIPFDYSHFDVYLVNGNKDRANLPVNQPTGMDNNLSKAIGMRYQFTPFSWLLWSLSAYYDIFSDADYYTDFLLYYGSDVALKFGQWTFKAGGIIGEIRSPNLGYSTTMIFNDTYTKYGYYTEADWAFMTSWKLRLRFGEINPMAQKIDMYDQYNVNVSIIWSLKPFEFAATYYHNWQNYHNEAVPNVNAPGQPMNDYDMVLLKALIKI